VASVGALPTALTSRFKQPSPFQFNPIVADLGKLVLRLLHKPGFFGTAKTFASLTASPGEMPRVPFTVQSEAPRFTRAVSALLQLFIRSRPAQVRVRIVGRQSTDNRFS
jgi:hypothetical protein